MSLEPVGLPLINEWEEGSGGGRTGRLKEAARSTQQWEIKTGERADGKTLFLQVETAISSGLWVEVLIFWTH